jgi:hypothetical protein
VATVDALLAHPSTAATPTAAVNAVLPDGSTALSRAVHFPSNIAVLARLLNAGANVGRSLCAVPFRLLGFWFFFWFAWVVVCMLINATHPPHLGTTSLVHVSHTTTALSTDVLPSAEDGRTAPRRRLDGAAPCGACRSLPEPTLSGVARRRPQPGGGRRRDTSAQGSQSAQRGSGTLAAAGGRRS